MEGRVEWKGKEKDGREREWGRRRERIEIGKKKVEVREEGWRERKESDEVREEERWR